MKPLVGVAALLAGTGAYPTGYTRPCPVVPMPRHGGTVQEPGPYTISLMAQGKAVDYYEAASTAPYTLTLSGPAFRGFIIACFAGAEASDFTATKAGALSAADQLSQPMGACEGGWTHVSRETKSNVTFDFTATVASGPVTCWALVVTSEEGSNYNVQLTVNESTGAAEMTTMTQQPSARTPAEPAVSVSPAAAPLPSGGLAPRTGESDSKPPAGTSIPENGSNDAEPSKASENASQQHPDSYSGMGYSSHGNTWQYLRHGESSGDSAAYGAYPHHRRHHRDSQYHHPHHHKYSEWDRHPSSSSWGHPDQYPPTGNDLWQHGPSDRWQWRHPHTGPSYYADSGPKEGHSSQKEGHSSSYAYRQQQGGYQLQPESQSQQLHEWSHPADFDCSYYQQPRQGGWRR